MKETADQLLRKYRYSIAGIMLSISAGVHQHVVIAEDEAESGTTEQCMTLNTVQEALLEAFRLTNETCRHNISVSQDGIGVF